MLFQVQVKVLAIFIDEDRVRRAGPGENLRVRVSGIEEEDILTGFVLCSVGMCFWICFYNFANMENGILRPTLWSYAGSLC